MVRGTTPTYTFQLPINTIDIQNFYITFRNKKSPSQIVEKDRTNSEIGEDYIKVTLTQEETLLFDYGAIVEVQIRVLTNGGAALASQIFTINVEKIIKDGVIE